MTPRAPRNETSDSAGAALARRILFWLGVLYTTAAVHAMTPYTFQLDDIKVTVLHVLGPALLVAYLALLGLGLVELPRKAVLVPLMVYFAAMVVSTLASNKYLHWVGRQVIVMRWVLLGPFVAYMGCCVEKKLLQRVVVFFTVMTLAGAIFGLAHRGWPPHGGIFTPILRSYEAQLKELTEKRDDYLASMQQARSREELDIYRMQVTRMEQRAYRIRTSYWYKMAATFQGAENQMLSFILNRTFYAAFLALVIPMCLALLLTTRSTVWQIVAAVTVFLASMCLFFTRSKTGYLVLVVEMVAILPLYLVAVKKGRHYGWRVVTLGACLLVLVLVLAAMNIPTLLAMYRGLDVSVEARSIIWGGSLDIWRENLRTILIGAGPGSFRILFSFYRRPDYFLWEISHRTLFSHNYFLDLLSETGLVGFGAMMTMLGVMFWKIFQRVRRHPDEDLRIIGSCLMVGMAGLFMENTTNPSIRWPICANVYWAALGIMAGMVNRRLVAGVRRDASPETRGEESAAEHCEEPRRVPSPAVRKTAWVLCALSVGGWAYTSYWGVQFFRSSMANNRGVEIMGREGSTTSGILGYQRMIVERRQQLSNLEPALTRTDLPSEELARLRAEADRLRHEIALLEDRLEADRQVAIAEFRKSVEIDPTFTTSYYKLANLYTIGPRGMPTTNDYEEALRVYQTLYDYWPEYSQVSFNLGLVSGQLGRQEEMLEHYARAARMTIDPGVVSESYIRALILASRQDEGEGRLEAAQEKSRKAVQAAKRLLEAWDWPTGRPLPADYTPATLRDMQGKVLDLFIRTVDAARDVDGQIEALKRLHALRPADTNLAHELASLYHSKGDFDGMRRFMEKALEENPLGLFERLYLGVACLELGRLREAKRQALILEKINADWPDTSYLLFRIYQKAGNNAGAAEQARSYLRIARNPVWAQQARDFLEGMAPGAGS